MVAPITSWPFSLFTGMDSPVAIDSSTRLLPSTTTPSVGIFSPGRTNIISPICKSFIGTSISLPSTIILALFAPISKSFLIAWDAFPFARTSKYFPSKWKVIMVVAISTKVCIGIKNPNNPIKYGGKDPRDTNTSILGLLFLSALKLPTWTCHPVPNTTGSPSNTTIGKYPGTGITNIFIIIIVIIIPDIARDISIFLFALLTSISSSSISSFAL